MIKFFKPRYRILYDQQEIRSYRLQMKKWWFPIWIDDEFYSYTTEESAKRAYDKMIQERDNPFKPTIIISE